MRAKVNCYPKRNENNKGNFHIDSTEPHMVGLYSVNSNNGHTLFEDGTISKYDVKFGNKTIKNIPTAMLEVVELKEHSHEATEEDDEEKDDE